MKKVTRNRWTIAAVTALHQLGGEASWSEIYKQVNNNGLPSKTKTWENTLRESVDKYTPNTSRGSRVPIDKHLFYHSGLGSGVRGLVEGVHIQAGTIYKSSNQHNFGVENTNDEQSTHTVISASDISKKMIKIYNLLKIEEDGCFLPLPTLERMLARLREKKNIILQGPPGTGKTWLAKRLAWVLAGEKGSPRVQALQFHATLSYEDFVCGWRPVGDSKLELLDGPFLEALASANKDPETPYVLVIEEINRGNPAQIFGELLTLLEADKRKPEEALRLCYQKSGECRTVHLPANLYLIGTMNIADRSLAIVDFALRRRFAFFDLTPHFGGDWQRWMCDRASLPSNFVAALGAAMQACNNVIANDHSLGPQYAIGHSFVTCDTPVKDPRAWIEQVVAAEIAPLLKEYWFNDLKKAEDTAQAIWDACRESLV